MTEKTIRESYVVKSKLIFSNYVTYTFISYGGKAPS